MGSCVKPGEHTQVGLLQISVISHSVIGLCSILAILFYGVGINIVLVDILAILNVISFLIYRKCVAIDIYEYIRGSLVSTQLPDSAKDNFMRNYIHKLTGQSGNGCEAKPDLTKLRLDIVDNVKPMVNVDEITLSNLFTRKIHYISINLILGVILLIKYNCHQFIPLIIAWFFYVFPVK